MYCTTCGNELPEGASVCDKCGAGFSPKKQNFSAEDSSSDPATAQNDESHRPYMDYKPFSAAYETTYENGEPEREENPYVQKGYRKNPYEEKDDFPPDRTGFAIASLVLGVIAICSCCLPILTIPLGILAVILAVFGMKSTCRGFAIAGLILGIIALVLGTMMLLIMLLSAGRGFHHGW